jgi:tetratricopeptide (TPR) repeat protein
LIAFVYSNILHAPFIFDDYADIAGNDKIRQLWPPTWSYHHPRPLVALTFALNYAVGQLDVVGYHVVNILLHVACAGLCFLVSRRVLKANLPALVAAAIWAVHPLNTTVVAYTVHRYESCAALGMLGALYFFQRSLEPGQNDSRLGLYSLICAAAAGASKEVAVATPFLLLAYDRCMAAGSFREAFRLRYKFHLASFATLTVVALLYLGAHKNSSQGFGLPDLTPLDYARSQLGVIVYYLRLALWPNALSFDYYDWPVAHAFKDVLPDAVLLASLAIGGVFAWVRHPPVGFVATVWLFILAPTSSFLPLSGELVAERRVYLPLFALTALVVAGAHRLAVSRRGLTLFIATSLLATTALAARTIIRNGDFATEEAAYRSVLALRPNNARARYQLGLVLSSQGNADAALTEFLRVVALEPRFARSQNNAGTLLARKGRLPEAEAHFLAAVRADPTDISFRLNLIESRVLQGKWAAALNTVRRGLERSPANVRLQASLHQVESLVSEHCVSKPRATPNCP